MGERVELFLWDVVMMGENLWGMERFMCMCSFLCQNLGKGNRADDKGNGEQGVITYVGTHATGDAALGTVGPEHEVFDDELAATLEELQEGNGFLLAVGVKGGEGVGFCDFYER